MIPATPAQIWEAWLDGERHAAMTGAPATSEGAEPGDRFTAWGGYISGQTVALEPPSVIRQSWRTLDFPAEAPDSRVEVHLEAVQEGTRVTFVHGGIPSGQGVNYEQGWVTHYLEPMTAFWSSEAG